MWLLGKGTGSCYLRREQPGTDKQNVSPALIWLVSFRPIIGVPYYSSALLPDASKKQKNKTKRGSDVSSDLLPRLNAMSSREPQSERTFLGRWRDDLTGLLLAWRECKCVQKAFGRHQLSKVVPSGINSISPLIWTKWFMSYGLME